MIKVFLTGDNHFGRRYERYPDVKDLLIASRVQSFKKAVEYANGFGADFFVVAGDLFDRVSGITREQVSEIVDILSLFEGTALVLPGNHDYFSGGEQVWKYFNEECTRAGADILFLNEYKPLELTVHGETTVFYPAFCRSKHGERNNLGWIKALKPLKPKEAEVYRIGIAHGAIEGITPDRQKEYFLMTEEELENIAVDAWLIGHTHVIYPYALKEDQFLEAGRIFNAGTHEQTDLSNNTDGCCIALELEKTDGNTHIKAKKVRTGQIRFEDIRLELTAAGREAALESALEGIKEKFTDKSVVRLTITGAITADEYNNRRYIYEKYLQKCLSAEIVDDELSELITREMIRREFAETSFAAKLLEELIDEPREAQMVYDLISGGA